MLSTTTEPDDCQQQDVVQEDPLKRSLNEIYGNRTGFWQSLSLILNAGLMVYAHLGVSATFRANIPPIDRRGLSACSALECPELCGFDSACLTDCFDACHTAPHRRQLQFWTPITPDTDQCARLTGGTDVETVSEWYTAFEIYFYESVEIAWKNGATLMAIVIAGFSGVWPYAKNIILLLLWYLPLTDRQRTNGLMLLRRLGKYTLVDIWAIILLVIGVQLRLDILGIQIMTKGEPRPGIIAFLVATLWEFFALEWMVGCHQKVSHCKVSHKAYGESLLVQKSYTQLSGYWTCKPQVAYGLLWVLWLTSVGLFVWGGMEPVAIFTTSLSFDPPESGCNRVYNIFQLGSALIDEFLLHDNQSLAEVWILFAAYQTSVAMVPLFVHLVQFLSLIYKPNKTLCMLADIVWTFCGLEVVLLAFFVIETKFNTLVADLSGPTGAAVFSIDSNVDKGFYLLIGYALVAGILQYLFSSMTSEYFGLEEHHKLDPVWGVFQCCFAPNDFHCKFVMNTTSSEEKEETISVTKNADEE